MYKWKDNLKSLWTGLAGKERQESLHRGREVKERFLVLLCSKSAARPSPASSLCLTQQELRPPKSWAAALVSLALCISLTSVSLTLSCSLKPHSHPADVCTSVFKSTAVWKVQNYAIYFLSLVLIGRGRGCPLFALVCTGVPQILTAQAFFRDSPGLCRSFRA